MGESVGAGVGMRLGFRKSWAYDDASPADELGVLALFVAPATACLILAPYDVWTGNDDGLDLRLRVVGSLASPAWVESSTASYSLGLAPSLRVASPNGVARFPSILGVILPEIGLTVASARDARFYMVLGRLPFGAWVSRRVGIDVEPGVWLGPVPWDPDAAWPSVALSFQASLSLR